MHLFKSPIKVKICYFLNLLIFSILASLFVSFDPLGATSISETDRGKDPIEEIKTELLQKKKQFLEFGIKEKSLLGQLSKIEEEIARKKALVKALKKRIRLQKMALEKQEKRLKQLEEAIKEIRDRLGKRLVAFYKYAKRGYMQLLITAEDLNQLRKGLQYLQIIMVEDQRLLEQMEDLRGKYNQEISSIQGKLDSIKNMEKEESDQLKLIQEDLDKKVILLVKIHKEKEFYEAAVKELQIAALDLKKTLLNLDKNQKKKKFFPLPTGFADLKGQLPRPCPGKIIKDHGPLGSKVLHTHKGIYIEGPLGAEVRAVFSGRVDFSGWLKGYGQLIIINHGSRYFTISAHLSERYKEEGDTVEKGDVIGLLGETGSLEGPRLYFEMRKAGNHLDPLKWLKVN